MISAAYAGAGRISLVESYDLSLSLSGKSGKVHHHIVAWQESRLEIAGPDTQTCRLRHRALFWILQAWLPTLLCRLITVCGLLKQLHTTAYVFLPILPESSMPSSSVWCGSEVLTSRGNLICHRGTRDADILWMPAVLIDYKSFLFSLISCIQHYH